MKKGVAVPALLLLAVLLFSLWNSRTIAEDTDHWCAQLQEVDTCAAAGDWAGAAHALAQSYEDWQGRQVFLHAVSGHSMVEEAEAMYRRCESYVKAREETEVRAELVTLSHQLHLLSKTERFSVGNIF